MIEKLPLEIDALSLLAEGLNFDFATKSMDEPMTDAELSGSDRHARRFAIMSSRSAASQIRRCGIFSNTTIVGRRTARSSVGRKRSRTILRKMFVNRGCDGFVVGGDARAGFLRGFRQTRRSRTAETRALSARIMRAGRLREKSRLADAENRRLEAIGRVHMRWLRLFGRRQADIRH